jgi:hypothetical protein
MIWRHLTQTRWNYRPLASAPSNEDAPTFHFGAGKRLAAEPRQNRRGAGEYGRKTKGSFKLLGRRPCKPIGWLVARPHAVEARVRWPKRLAELDLASLQSLEEAPQHGNAFAARAPFPRNAGQRRQAPGRRRTRARGS